MVWQSVMVALLYLDSISSQPHPYGIGYSLHANATCTDGCRYELDPIYVCLLLDYFPIVCSTSSFSTTIKGIGIGCSLHGSYNSTIVTLQALDDGLPQENWALNWTHTGATMPNPLLPMQAKGLPNTNPMRLAGVPCDDKCSCDIWAKQTDTWTTGKRVNETQLWIDEGPVHYTKQCGDHVCAPGMGCECM